MVARETPARDGVPPTLPVYERLAPAVAGAALAARIAAASEPGDVVIDLFGRGGWTARAAIAMGRRALSMEITPLTRLLADVVVRPPDLRHLDAAFQAVAAAPRGTTSLRAWVTEAFSTRCPTCGRALALEELVWEPEGRQAGAPVVPTRRSFRCAACLDRRGRGGELRQGPPEAADLELAAAPADLAVRAAAGARFPLYGAPGEALVDALLDLHSPRQLAALNGILERIDGDLRASQVTSALRLAFLHAVLPSSRLNGYPGRMSPLRITGARLRAPGSIGWRERNPWLAFEEGFGLVRGFVQGLEDGQFGVVQARLTDPLDGLPEGAPMVSLRVGADDALDRLAAEGAALAPAARARIRLVVGAGPIEWTLPRLAEAFVLTAWTLGSEAARLIPFEPLLDPEARPYRRAAALRASLEAVVPALATDATATVLLDPDGNVGLAGAALAAASAGWRVEAAAVAEPRASTGGTIQLVPPVGRLGQGPRSRANRRLAVEPGGAGDPTTVAGRGLFAGREPIDGRFSRSEAAQVVSETAVAVLQARGEPAEKDRLLGPILVGLDRSGQLHRFASGHARGTVGDGVDGGAPSRSGSATPPGTGDGAAAPPAAALPAAGPTAGAGDAPPADEPPPSPAAIAGLLGIIESELGRADNRRLAPSEGDRIWLADPRDEAAAAVPLADRVEWAVFSLLGTGIGIAEGALRDRLSSIFEGPDAPDPWLVDACLASYAIPGSGGRLISRDDLQHRSAEHSDTIAALADLGHRMGLRVAISPREQPRRAGGVPLASRLARDEQNPALAFLGRAGAEAVEAVDCLWYVRPRFAFLFEVEWTAMVGEPLLRRGRAVPADGRVVRFLVTVPERTALLRAKLEHSPVLRKAMDDGNWHVLRTDALHHFAALAEPSLDGLEPYLGFEPAFDRPGDQLPLFEG